MAIACILLFEIIDARTARLLDRIVEIGHGIDPRKLPGGDIVHWDLHSGNLLQIGDRLRPASSIRTSVTIGCTLR